MEKIWEGTIGTIGTVFLLLLLVPQPPAGFAMACLEAFMKRLPTVQPILIVGNSYEKD